MIKEVYLMHSDIMMPSELTKRVLELERTLDKYSFSGHIKEHFENEHKSYNYTLEDLEDFIEKVRTAPIAPFEVEFSVDDYNVPRVTKYVVRGRHKDGMDVAIVVRPKYVGRSVVENVIVTAWCNASDDEHSTLDRSKYTSALPIDIRFDRMY